MIELSVKDIKMVVQLYPGYSTDSQQQITIVYNSVFKINIIIPHIQLYMYYYLRIYKITHIYQHGALILSERPLITILVQRPLKYRHV